MTYLPPITVTLPVSTSLNWSLALNGKILGIQAAVDDVRCEENDRRDRRRLGFRSHRLRHDAVMGRIFGQPAAVEQVKVA